MWKSVILFIALLVSLPDKKASKGTATTASEITFISTLKTVFSDHKLLFLVMGGIIMWLSYVQLDSVFPIYLVKEFPHGTRLYAEIIAVNALMACTMQPLVSKLMLRFSFMRQVTNSSYIFHHRLWYLCDF